MPSEVEANPLSSMKFNFTVNEPCLLLLLSIRQLGQGNWRVSCPSAGILAPTSTSGLASKVLDANDLDRNFAWRDSS